MYGQRRNHHYHQQQQQQRYNHRDDYDYDYDYGNGNGNGNINDNNHVGDDDLLWDDDVDVIPTKQAFPHRYDHDKLSSSSSSSPPSSSEEEGSDDDENDSANEEERRIARHPCRYNDDDNNNKEYDTRGDYEYSLDHYHEKDNDSHASSSSSSSSSSTSASSSSSSSSSSISSVFLSVDAVIEKIEELILQTVIEPLIEEEPGPFLPEIDVDNPKTHFKRKLSFHHLTQARSLTSILMVASFCHDLLAPSSQSVMNNEDDNNEKDSDDDDDVDIEDGNYYHRRRQNGRRRRRTTTTREVYYFFVTHFRDQRECDKAIWDLVSILNLPSRQSLGLVASPKGWFCGSIDVYNGHTNELKFNGRELDTHGMAITPSTYDNDYTTYNNSKPTNNDRDPMDDDDDNNGNGNDNIRIESDARCILVIEKEGVYTRLSEDKFFLNYLPCILVTGKGFPDIATRRWVRRMQKTLKIPVYGLCDCNPYGVSVLDTYRYDKGVKIYNVEKRRKKKSDDEDDPLEIQWIGLRPSQIEHMNLPSNVFQELTNNDKKRLDSLLVSSKSKSRTTPKNKTSKSFAERGGWNKEERVRELQAMYKYKVELEALHWKGMDYMCKFVYETILGHEKKQEEESVRRRRRRHRRHGDFSDSDSSDNNSIDPDSGVDDNENEHDDNDDDNDQNRDEKSERQTYII